MILVISWQCTALDDSKIEVHKIEGISKSTVQGVSLFQSFFEREHITIEKQKKTFGTKGLKNEVSLK